MILQRYYTFCPVLSLCSKCSYHIFLSFRSILTRLYHFPLLGVVLIHVFHFKLFVVFRSVLQGVVVSSFGKLMAIPLIIWGQSQCSIYNVLMKLLVITSNTAAFRGEGDSSICYMIYTDLLCGKIVLVGRT